MHITEDMEIDKNELELLFSYDGSEQGLFSPKNNATCLCYI